MEAPPPCPLLALITSPWEEHEMNAACSIEGWILDVALPLSSSSSLPVSLSLSAHERRTRWESRTSRGQSTTPTAPTPSTVVHNEEWLEWLLVKICVEEMFEILFTTLGSTDGVGKSDGDESGNGSPYTEDGHIFQQILICHA